MMDPTSTPEEPPPPYKLFTPKAISAGAFIGGPLAVTVLVANNFAKLGDKHSRNRTYILGLGMTVSIAWIFATTPQSTLDKIPNAAFAALWSTLAYFLTEKLQGNKLRTHFDNLGQKASGWAVFGWSVLSAAIYLGIALLFFPLIPPYDFEGETYTEGLLGNEIYYSENIDTQIVSDLGNYLVESEYFDSEYPNAIELTKDSTGYHLTFPCYRNLWNDQENLKTFKDFGAGLATDLNLQPLSIELVDDDFTKSHRKKLN
tara:strand:- start:33 stop:809 length:777 start_codon:yes stop_codon:yes gene_type:complete